MRGFRIGKSVSGNWWVSIGFPFGFRYTWLIGRSKLTANPANHNAEVIIGKSPEILLENKASINSSLNRNLIQK